MKALSDPNRARTLKLLEERELCVCEIQKLLGLAQSTVSKHMKILEDAGLVERKRQGSWIMYSLPEKAETIYAKAMLGNLHQWLNQDKELHSMRLGLPEAAKARDCCPTK